MQQSLTKLTMFTFLDGDGTSSCTVADRIFAGLLGTLGGGLILFGLYIFIWKWLELWDYILPPRNIYSWIILIETPLIIVAIILGGLLAVKMLKISLAGRSGR